MNNKKYNSLKTITAVIIAIIIIAIIVLVTTRSTKETIYTITLQNEQQILTLKTDKEGFLDKPDDPFKEGYIFLGWYNGNEKVDFSKAFTKDISIEARWEKLEDDKESMPKPETEGEVKVEEPKEQPKEEEENVPKQEQTATKPQIQKPEKEEQKPQKPEIQKPEIEKPQPEKPEQPEVPEQPKPEQPEQPKPEEPEEPEKVTYSVKWSKVDGSAIEQYRLYIINSKGEYVNGTLEITTIAGKTFEENVTTNGSTNIYIKSAIQTVKIKNIK